MKTECPACRQHYEVPEEQFGSTVTCQTCNAEFTVRPMEAPVLRPAAAAAGPVLLTGAPAVPWRPPLLRRGAAGALSGTARMAIPGGRFPWRVLYDVRIFLRWLADGSLIRNVTAGMVYLGASVAGAVCLGIWLQSLELFKLADGAIGLFGALLWMVFFPYSCFLAVSAAFARAGEIRRLPAGQFAIFPILSVLVNLGGEVVFILCAAWSVPVALLSWGCYTNLALAVDLPLSNGLVLGIGLFILMWLIGYSVYLFTRWLQEMINVFPSMAHHLDLVEKHLRPKTGDK